MAAASVSISTEVVVTTPMPLGSARLLVRTVKLELELKPQLLQLVTLDKPHTSARN